ncbi:MAG TPA: response regulator [Polyangiaceae bacterium]|jgi:CheY-like chemotaxis protein|nr:response regulator [Polyangiaceae bacterium]
MKSNLLIVDDKPANLLALEAILSDFYNVIPAHSGLEALDLLATKEVDVILLDVEMPQMDGYETARRVKKMERYQDIPIIFTSAVFMDDPYVKKGYECGAVDYFTKPFDADLLRKKVAIYASLAQKDLRIMELEQRIADLERLLSATPGVRTLKSAE